MSLVDRFAEAFDPAPLVQAASLWLPNLLIAAVTTFGFWLLGRILARAIDGLGKRSRIDATALSFLHGTTRLVVLTLGTVTVLSQIGVDVSGLITGLGVAGLTIGFAARDTLSNIISGVFIFWDRPFVIGDLVDVDGRYGRVEEITMRSTRIITVDGRMLAIPNATIVNSVVASYTNFPHLRIDVDVTVDVSSDIGRCREILLGLVDDPEVWMSEPAPVVVVTELGDYFVRLEVRAWVHNERDHIKRRMGLREAIFHAFNQAGVNMPYETIQLRPVLVEGVDSGGRSSGDKASG